MGSHLRYLYCKPSRHGTPRWYVRVPGKKLARLPIKSLDDPRLGPLYANALKGEIYAPAHKGSLRELCASYKKFLTGDTTVAERTKYVRGRHLDELCSERLSATDARLVGDMPASALTSANLQKLLDRRRATPEAANDKRKCISAMFVWAVPRGHARSNPVLGTKRIKTATGGFQTWTLPHIRQFVERHPPGTTAHLALALLLFTGQRRSDVIRFGPEHVSAGVIRFNQQKGNRQMDIPILPQLAPLLPASSPFLLNGFGNGFSAAGFGNWFHDRCTEAGLKGLAAHGLRKALQAIGADAGLSDRQLMAIAGHETAKETTRYTQRRDRAHLAKTGMAQLGHIQIEPPPQGGSESAEKLDEIKGEK